MKAIIQEKYGGPELLSLVDISIPKYNDKEVLIKIKAVNVSSGDMRVNTLGVSIFLRGIMRLVFGFKGPRNKVRGITASGEIINAGLSVNKYKVGDEVYFINSMKASCLTEYIVLEEKSVMAKKPKNITFEEAAPLAFGAMTAYHFINEKTIKKDNKVLIYGASGSVGTYALQLAKYYGADVTAVSSVKNHEVLLELGANHVIDYRRYDFRTHQKQYDVIFDAVLKISKRSCKKVLKKNGKYLTVMMPSKESSDRLRELNKIIKNGKLKTVIDKVYRFEDFHQAHIHTYSGHKLGNVIIKV